MTSNTLNPDRGAAARERLRTSYDVALIDEFPPHYALLDGYDTASDGLAGMMGCTRPRAARRFYAGADVLAVDCVAARHVGVAET